MTKWGLLGLLFIVFFLLYFWGSTHLGLHSTFMIQVIFFTVQTFILFRLEARTPPQWVAHTALIKISLRFFCSLIFLLVLMSTRTDLKNLVIQFLLLYLIFMLFEIGSTCAKLRQN